MDIHNLTNLPLNEYHFLMAQTAILCGFCVMLVTFLIISNLKG
ncbi:Uncharacterised protein [Campylobacter hyointestinalis]|uniref:Uncharacterized protein n=1 Tax=Campylobacter hyointestinalis subsp. hyointestinalis TaxID=91352 RepID=A0A9W5EWX7_CAMHY|nr:hypothetical protein [Campylobacter hyointestinalis]MDL2346936.1 hypothetical protein [Campylobacter hyointestinalis]MDL2348452.1 hypothetical protein [Campylobacter hyointestinalis]MDL2350423.1 hypothetical protein [Campylobacter hyointestinalis]MDM1026028.1 hypothetical protein [Campylobacter hyointestinalis]MDM1027203.1 hypothetical protein [Campylobacter hyointestinalis]